MKDTGSLHLKVQEYCDCYATTDYLKEMSAVASESDKEEGALKWLALAVLHGINEGARKVSLVRKTDDGSISVKAKYRKTDLPSPGEAVGGKVFDVLKGITHLDGERGEIPLALGIRDSSVELQVKMKKKDGEEKVSIKFPE